MSVFWVLFAVWAIAMATWAIGLPLVRMLSARYLERVLCWAFPVTDIPAPDGRLYLRRWHLWPARRDRWREAEVTKWCLHKICLSDEDRDPHSHPSGFTTLCLAGGYEEQTFYLHTLYGRLPLGKRTFRPGRILRNRPGHIHRVSLIGGRPAWTLVRMQPAEGPWGFVRPDGTTVPVDQYRAREIRHVAQVEVR